MSKHTPEPWKMNGHSMTHDISYDVDGPDNRMIAIVYPISGEENKANAARIVACVNACAGMDDPIAHIQRLRDLYEDLHAVQDESRKVAAERDKLKAERDFNFKQWQEISDIALKCKRERNELIRVLQVVEKAIQNDRSYQNTHRTLTSILNKINP